MRVIIETLDGHTLDDFVIRFEMVDDRTTVAIGGLRLGFGRPSISREFGRAAVVLAKRITRYVRERMASAR